jgi:hypothetical protein
MDTIGEFAPLSLPLGVNFFLEIQRTLDLIPSFTFQPLHRFDHVADLLPL